jgi:hypothetical protein
MGTGLTRTGRSSGAYTAMEEPERGATAEACDREESYLEREGRAERNDPPGKPGDPSLGPFAGPQHPMKADEKHHPAAKHHHRATRCRTNTELLREREES